jgi:hypothetical protein
MRLDMNNKRAETKKEDVSHIKGPESESVALRTEDSSSDDTTALSHKRKHAPPFTLNHFSSDEDWSEDDVDENSVKSSEQGGNESLSSDESDNGRDFDSNQDVDHSGSSKEEGPEESGIQWKTNLALKAADAFLERQSTTHNLWKLVYGKCGDCMLLTYYRRLEEWCLLGCYAVWLL